MPAEIVPFHGFERNLRLTSGDAALVATLEVGPRILFFGRGDGPNLLKVYERDAGKKGDNQYHSYGGHRLWVAPEDPVTTYASESSEPMYREEDGLHVFSLPGNSFGIGKQIALRALGEGAFALRHSLTNTSEGIQLVAPWAITVMAPGGECVVPQAEFAPQPENLLPRRPLALWAYTRMSDPRYTWGDHVIRLRHDAAQDATKFGTFVDQGIAAYSLGEDLFVKRFGADAGAQYPDFGCNFEAFTRQDMLEVETLGSLVALEPGAATVHDETWYLLSGISLPSEDRATGDLLRELAERCPPRIV
ncbi:MAG: hypothetical protein C4320_04150 [Armatimonadota bacterium]